jgi:hypothetical protein
MSGNIDKAFILLNMALVVRVVYFNAREAREGFVAWRPTRFITAVFGCVYLLSYTVVLTGAISRLTWSYVMVGVSPIVWEVVWTWPARRTRMIRKQMVATGVVKITDRANAA